MRIPQNATYNVAKCDDRPGFYYVSIVDGPQFGLLAGPYSTHREALDKVQPAKECAYRVNPTQCAFASFGTCRLENDAGLGILNKHGKL